VKTPAARRCGTVHGPAVSRWRIRRRCIKHGSQAFDPAMRALACLPRQAAKQAASALEFCCQLALNGAHVQTSNPPLHEFINSQAHFEFASRCRSCQSAFAAGLGGNARHRRSHGFVGHQCPCPGQRHRFRRRWSFAGRTPRAPVCGQRLEPGFQVHGWKWRWQGEPAGSLRFSRRGQEFRPGRHRQG